MSDCHIEAKIPCLNETANGVQFGKENGHEEDSCIGPVCGGGVCGFCGHEDDLPRCDGACPGDGLDGSLRHDDVPRRAGAHSGVVHDGSLRHDNLSRCTRAHPGDEEIASRAEAARVHCRRGRSTLLGVRFLMTACHASPRGGWAREGPAPPRRVASERG